MKRARSRKFAALPLNRDQRLLTVREVAGMLFVSRTAIHNMIRRGELRAWYFGRAVRLHHRDVLSFMRLHELWVTRHRARQKRK
jgi:excisionase family DNA binding protein